jgi:hypothetical protein
MNPTNVELLDRLRKALGMEEATADPVEEVERMKSDLDGAHWAIATASARLERIGRGSLWFSNPTDDDLFDARAALAVLADVPGRDNRRRERNENRHDGGHDMPSLA